MSVSAEASYRLRYGVPVAGEPPAEWTEVLAQQLAHRSVRRYRADGEVSDETLSALIAAAQSAPTSGNLQLWSVVAVREDARRHRLAALAGEQEFIAQAPLFLVWLADLARARQVTSNTGSTTAEGADFVEAALLSFIDVALAAHRFGSVAGLKGREHLRAALLDRGFQLR